jgi:alkanesulfonate monooxygenase SsuD/methylene tetrahydromethanopterin reductase-like flavin-dependent oxidoreductase (luciferase family)
MTLRAVARHANACNLFGDPATVRAKLATLRRHCDENNRDYNEIERTCTTSFLLAPTEAGAQAKSSPIFRGLVGTPAQATDLVGQYQDAGIQLLISSTWHNDFETQQLLASEVMPKFK